MFVTSEASIRPDVKKNSKGIKAKGNVSIYCQGQASNREPQQASPERHHKYHSVFDVAEWVIDFTVRYIENWMKSFLKIKQWASEESNLCSAFGRPSDSDWTIVRCW